MEGCLTVGPARLFGQLADPVPPSLHMNIARPSGHTKGELFASLIGRLRAVTAHSLNSSDSRKEKDTDEDTWPLSDAYTRSPMSIFRMPLESNTKPL